MNYKTYENPVFGDKAVFLKTSEETQGNYTLLEIELAPHGGNSPHFHRAFSETFEAIEGALGVRVGKEHKILQAGESYTVSPKTPHCFYNPSDASIKFRVTLTPGHSGFENSIKIAYGLATDGLTNQKGIPKKLSHLALLATMSGTNPTGLFSLALPIFKWKAGQARRQGVEEELFEKYCR